MTLPLANSVPAAPICRTVDGASPCPFVSCCHETRQRTAHYAPSSLGGPIRGMACVFYNHYADVFPNLLARPRSDAELERDAIASEGSA